MVASKNGHTETVSLLLHNGADVNASKNNGWFSLTVLQAEPRIWPEQLSA